MAKKPKDEPLSGRRAETRKVIVDFSLLSEEEKVALRERAAEKIAEQLKEEAEDEFLQQAMREERRKHGAFVNDLPQDKVDVLIDLPDYAPFLSINGKRYYHNFTYTVERHVFNSLNEIMSRAWEHQSEIEGRSKHYYAKKKAPMIGKRAA